MRRGGCLWVWLAAACLALASVRAGEPQPETTGVGGTQPRVKTAGLPTMKGVPWSGAWRVLGGTLGISGLALAAALLWRKRGARAWRSPAGDGLQVLGRAALSPRHHVFVLRFGDRKVLVGVSGDRMSSLAVIEDGAPAGSRWEAVLPERGIPERRAAERDAGSSRGAVSEADLLPYRRQVDRLRELLRGRPPLGSAGREE